MAIQAFFPTFIYDETLISSPRPAPTGRKSKDLRSRGHRAAHAKLRAFNRDLLEQCYLVQESDEEGNEWSRSHYANGYTSYGSISDLHLRYPHFEELAGLIDRHARKFARHLQWDLGAGRLRMVSCWVNIMPTNTVHSLHLHPLSVISGTYYVEVPKDAPSIKFEDPRLASMMAAPPRQADAKPRNQPFVKMQPTAGQVLLWESWLRHEVPSNQSSKDRVSISFNYDWV